MAFKKAAGPTSELRGKPRAISAGEQDRDASRLAAELQGARATIAALKANLAGATEPALRKRLAAAVAALEQRAQL